MSMSGDVQVTESVYGACSKIVCYHLVRSGLTHVLNQLVLTMITKVQRGGWSYAYRIDVAHEMIIWLLLDL